MAQHIIVVDDDWSMRVLFSSILSDEGWLVSDYNYATVKLTDIRQLRPDLIILDINMHQDGVGWSFLQLLKMEDTTAGIPILICTTAGHLSSEIESYLATQHIGLIRKPFENDVLFGSIQQIFLQAKQSYTPLNKYSALSVLVVEDNNTLRKIISMVLKLEGFKVMTAADGQQALDAVSMVRFSLILLDIQMPIMDGFEFLKVYDERLVEHSPVIILSGDADAITQRLPSFVIDKVQKPFEVNHVLRLITKHTQLI